MWKKWLHIESIAVIVMLQLLVLQFFYFNSLSKKEKLVRNQTQMTMANKSNIKKRAYLTFDDGPSLNTGELLQVLRENNVKATFFVLGKEDDCSKDYYKQIVKEGHTLGIHAYNHDYNKLYQSEQSFQKDFKKIHQLLLDVTGVDVKYYRFPGGSSNTVSKVPIKKLIRFLHKNGVEYYDWNALNEDAVTVGLTTGQLNKNIMKDVSHLNSAVILMHDLNESHNTIDALPDLIKTLRKQGFELLPIDENTPLVQHVQE